MLQRWCFVGTRHTSTVEMKVEQQPSEDSPSSTSQQRYHRLSGKQPAQKTNFYLHQICFLMNYTKNMRINIRQVYFIHTCAKGLPKTHNLLLPAEAEVEKSFDHLLVGKPINR